VKFQRTRGVLRLMAAVIHRLWENNDRSPLIVPASVPLDDPAIVSQLTGYLPGGWETVLEKDVDGFHPVNMGRLVAGLPASEPCTPKGIMRLLKSTGLTLSGKEAVVIGRSNIVGKPVASLLLREHCTVTMCHSRTRDLPGVAREADILVVAIGRPRMVDASYIKPGATVIDVGISRAEDGSLVGDVDFESASQVAGKITPVPKGVGPMTIAMLLQSTVNAAARAVS